MAEGAPVLSALARAAREVRDGTWNFVGFNWPVIAARGARVLGKQFVEVYECGAAVSGLTDEIPSSTTDYDAYASNLVWRGSTADVFAMVPRLSACFLDASTVDLRGAVNTFGTGGFHRPQFRSAGGGGSADAAVRARRAVLFYMADDLSRLTRRLEEATAIPKNADEVVLICRGGNVLLGDHPRLAQVEDSAGGQNLLAKLHNLGVETDEAHVSPPTTAEELRAMDFVLTEAASRGSRVALAALKSRRSP